MMLATTYTLCQKAGDLFQLILEALTEQLNWQHLSILPVDRSWDGHLNSVHREKSGQKRGKEAHTVKKQISTFFG